MNFENEVFDWENAGTEPSEDRKAKGFETGYKPPAGIFNAFWHRVTRAIKELQTKFGNHADNQENPHGVTAKQLGLDKVNNTSDAEKSVMFASEAGVGRKVQHALSVRFKGGSTEGTDLWTYDGSTSRSINITAPKIGAASDDLSNVEDAVFISKVADLVTPGVPIVEATSTDGIAYSVNIEGVTELYNGMELIIIPNMTSKSKQTTLAVNGLTRQLRMSIGGYNFGNSGTVAALDGWLGENYPVAIQYKEKFNNWQTITPRPSVSGLYGTVKVEQGGTGATTPAEARENLGLSFLEHLYHHEVRIKLTALNTTDYNSADKEILLCFNYKGVELPYRGFAYYTGGGCNDVLGYTFNGVQSNGNYFSAMIKERTGNGIVTNEYYFMIADVTYASNYVKLY